MIKQFLNQMKERKGQFKQVQAQDRIHTIVEERKKSSNERELERFMEEERQKQITHDLGVFRKKRHEEGMKTTVIGGPEIFKGKKTTVLINNDKLLNMKKDKGGNLFFK